MYRSNFNLRSLKQITHGQYFNPRSPRGERRPACDRLRTSRNFNPRSPRGERLAMFRLLPEGARFQSTLPARGATTSSPPRMVRCIHFNPRSPRGERRRASRSCPGWRHFNPRSPRGERPAVRPYHHLSVKFQSTLPARGATLPPQRLNRSRSISIHAPREGSDNLSEALKVLDLQISIHAPREGSDTA